MYIIKFLTCIKSGAVFCGTIYQATQFKKKLQRSETLRVRMQPSVLVIANDSNKQIKTHPEARQVDSINSLLELYERLPPEVHVTGATMKEKRFYVVISIT